MEVFRASESAPPELRAKNIPFARTSEQVFSTGLVDVTYKIHPPLDAEFLNKMQSTAVNLVHEYDVVPRLPGHLAYARDGLLSYGIYLASNRGSP